VHLHWDFSPISHCHCSALHKMISKIFTRKLNVVNDDLVADGRVYTCTNTYCVRVYARVCVCVCVCKREREREREHKKGYNIKQIFQLLNKESAWVWQYVCWIKQCWFYYQIWRASYVIYKPSVAYDKDMYFHLCSLFLQQNTWAHASMLHKY